MSDYKTYLSKLKVDDLKALVMSLKQHFKFNITKKKKNDFIEYLLTHTTREDGIIKIIDDMEVKVMYSKMSKAKELLHIYKLKGKITKLEDIIEDNIYRQKDKKINEPILKEIEEIKMEIKHRATNHKINAVKDKIEIKTDSKKEIKKDSEKKESKKDSNKSIGDIKEMDVDDLKLMLFKYKGRLSRLNKEVEGITGKTKDKLDKEILEVKTYIRKILDLIKSNN